MIVLLRHGNTFLPGQTPRMVGAHEDLPLVPSGFEQAEAAARAFEGLEPWRVLTGPLQRTREYAGLLGLGPLTVDERLREVDYGSWAGHSDDELKLHFGEEALTAWRERGVFHEQFEETAESARARLKECLREQLGLTFVVSSNGLLRTLHPDGAPVGTGKACVLDGERIVLWNVTPADARKCL